MILLDEVQIPDPYVYQPDEQEDEEIDLDRRIRRAHERLRRLSIIGAPDIDVEGGWDTGYGINSRRGGGGGGGAGIGACCIGTVCKETAQADCNGKYLGDGTSCSPNPCPGLTQPGACCFLDGHCTFENSPNCSLHGGIFQGIGTTCSPNPCPQPIPTGACCVMGVCNIHTQSDCITGGGVYQGDQTHCTPNPCTFPCCGACAGFTAFDGSGRKFLTMTSVMSWSDMFGLCSFSATGNKVDSFDSLCNESCSCAGSSVTRSGPQSINPCTYNSVACIGAIVNPPVASAGPGTGLDMIGCDYNLCESCTGMSATLASVFAAQATYNLAAGGGLMGSGTITFTLSNECNTTC